MFLSGKAGSVAGEEGGFGMSGGHEEDLFDQGLILDVHFAAVGMQQKERTSVGINDGSIRADIVRQDAGGEHFGFAFGAASAQLPGLGHEIHSFLLLPPQDRARERGTVIAGGFPGMLLLGAHRFLANRVAVQAVHGPRRSGAGFEADPALREVSNGWGR